MSTNISQYSNASENTKSIQELRNNSIDQDLMERIVTDHAEIVRANQEAKERMPGSFVSFKEDKETHIFLFTNYQRLNLSLKDFKTGQIIPNRTTTKFRFQVYETGTGMSDDIAPTPQIWETGRQNAEQILYFMEQGQNELTIRRNGPKYSQQTSYTIYPVTR